MGVDIDLLASIPKEALMSVMRAGKEKDTEKDYTILSVAATTLGLILVVELIRHKVDHMATGKFFFTTVLDGIYRECKCNGWKMRTRHA